MRVVVEWETDGEEVDLPKEVEVPDDVDDVADWLSDKYGFLVNSWSGHVG